MKFATSAVLLALAVALVRGDVATIKSDVAKIDSAVTALNKQLASDNLNYFSALAIDSASKDLDTQIKQGTADVKANTETVTSDDANEIIATLTGTEKNVVTATDRLVVLKPKFDGLGVTGIARDDINALSTDTADFGDALVAAAPAAQQPDARAL